MYVNTVIISGRLGADPEYRELASGKGLAHARVAASKKRGDQYVPIWFKVTAFERAATDLAACSKGDEVLIEGRLDYEEWTSKEGVKRFEVLVIASGVTMVPRKERGKQKQAENTDEIPF